MSVGSTLRSWMFLAVLATGCAPATSFPKDTESIGAAASAIIHGTASAESQNAVVLLYRYDPSGTSGTCTGTLLAPNLVLTARHCVSELAEDATPCDERAMGSPILGDLPPEHFFVFPGSVRATYDESVPVGVHGVAIVHDGADHRCGHDLALLVLNEALGGVPIAPVRLETGVQRHDALTAVGWGVTERELFPGHRQQRNVAVTGVGPQKASRAIAGMPAGDFSIGEGTCFGDSGGPAFDPTTGAVVGVDSRGGGG